VIAVQLYSVRASVGNDLEGALERLAAVGVTAVEPYYSLFEEPDRFAAAIRAVGMAVPSVHAPVLREADPTRLFETAARLGIGTVIDPVHRGEDWETEDGIARVAERLNEAAARAAEHGLAFGYHNHEWELSTRPGGTPALELLAARLDPAVVLEVDTYWAQVGGVDAPGLLTRLGDRVRFIHVKDGPLTRDVDAQVPAGQGGMDVPAVLEAAPNALRVVEFDGYTGDVIDAIGQSVEFIQARDAA
jgi:sugar phosphate isomerase/epimerase